MKIILFLAIWLDDVALILGMLFATEFTSYKIWVALVIILDIISTIALSLMFKKDSDRISKVMSNVTIETKDKKIFIKGNKKELLTLFNSISKIIPKVNSDTVSLTIDKEVI